MLNVYEDRETGIVKVGKEQGLHLLGDLNDSGFTKEVHAAVREMKTGKSGGLNGCVIECLKSGRVAVVEWLVILITIVTSYGS